MYCRYAHYLFENGSYEEAMEHLLASQVELTYVLSLYPYIVLPKSSLIPEPDKPVDVVGDVSYLPRDSSGMSDDMEPPPPQILEFDESGDLQTKKINHNTLMALIKFLQKRRYSIIEKAAAEGTEEVVSDAVGSNIISYGNNRAKRAAKVSSALFGPLN